MKPENEMGSPLRQTFFDRDVVTVARELIGSTLQRRERNGIILAGTIVETEAYRHDDRASHAYTGRSKRNAAMFGPPGYAYVYRIYGMYDCFNAVCGAPGVANAVLIRAIQPTVGIAYIWQNRFGTDQREFASRATTRRRLLTNLASGPGKLCQALGITRSEIDGCSLESGPITIHPARLPVRAMTATRRIGISKEVEKKWRFFESGNQFVSRPQSIETPKTSINRSRSAVE